MKFLCVFIIIKYIKHSYLTQRLTYYSDHLRQKIRVRAVSYTHLDVYKRQMQNGTELDRKVDIYSWWKATVAMSTKSRCQGNDAGSAHLWTLRGVRLGGFSRL